MRKTIARFIVLAGTFAASLPLKADTWTDPETGITWTYMVSDGKATVGGGSSSAVNKSITGSIVIPSNLNGCPVVAIGNYAFGSCSGLTDVMIPNGVNSIGDEAFRYCYGLKSLTISDTVTRIGNGAFNSCTNLTAVTIPDSVTSIGSYPFYNCSSLTNISVDINNVAYKSVNGLLLTTNGKTLVQGVNGAVTIPYGVTNVGEKVFYGCHDLTSVIIPDSVTSIEKQAFLDCRGLTSVSIPNSVTSIAGFSFSGCSGLTNVTIGSGVKNIESGAFYGCSGLTNIVVSGMNGSYKSVNGLLLTKDGKTLVHGINGSAMIPNGVTRIGNYAFGKYAGLTSVQIPDTMINIGDGAFEVCTGLTSVTIPNSVASIGNYAFLDCNGITNAIIGNSVTSIGAYAFCNCSGLTSVILPDSVTNIGVYAFKGCSGITSITIPSGLTITSSLFAYCSGLVSFEVDSSNQNYSTVNGLLLSKDGGTLILVPCGLTDVTIPDGVTSIGEAAFGNCSGLTVVTIPDGVTSIGESAFENCSSLTNVVIPYGVANIGNDAFYGCRALSSVSIPDTVTDIGYSAFGNCTNLTSITIPEGVNTLGKNAFSSCKNLTSISLPSTLKRIDYSCLFARTSLMHLTMFGGMTFSGRAENYTIGLLEIEVGDGSTSFDTTFFAKAAGLKTQVETLILPASVTNVELAAVNQLVNLTKIVFKGASRSAIQESDLQYLISSGLEVVFEDDGSGGGGGGGETPKLATQRMVRIVNSGMRTDNPNVFDVTYVVSNMTETANVRILAFMDGVRSFANVLRPTTFVDGTEANVGSNVLANVEHTVSWNVADDWNIDLGRVSVEVLTLEDCAIPLKLMTIPRTSSHAAVRFSYNALTSAKVLDALLWHYASPDSGLTLADGVLASGGIVLANGTEVTEEGVRYVLESHGYRLLEGDELEYVKRLSRLSLEPSGARQYGIVTLEN